MDISKINSETIVKPQNPKENTFTNKQEQSSPSKQDSKKIAMALTGLAILGTAALGLAFALKKGKVDISKASSDSKEIIETIEQKISKLEEEAYKCYERYDAKQTAIRATKEGLTGDGGFGTYIQRILGFNKYDLDSYETLNDISLKTNEQLLSGLSHEIGKVDRSFANARPSVLKEAFFNNLNYQEKLDPEAKVELLQKTIERYAIDEKKLSDENYVVAKSVFDSVKNRVGTSKINVQNVSEFKSEIAKLSTDLEKILNDAGLEVKYYSDELSDEFKSAFAYRVGPCDQVPAIMHNGNVKCYGKISA